jgi:hypothetical protein
VAGTAIYGPLATYLRSHFRRPFTAHHKTADPLTHNVVRGSAASMENTRPIYSKRNASIGFNFAALRAG